MIRHERGIEHGNFINIETKLEGLEQYLYGSDGQKIGGMQPKEDFAEQVASPSVEVCAVYQQGEKKVMESWNLREKATVEVNSEARQLVGIFPNIESAANFVGRE